MLAPLFPDRHMGLTTGSRLGNYPIVAPLGAGGMGKAWKARDRRPACEGGEIEENQPLAVMVGGFERMSAQQG